MCGGSGGGDGGVVAATVHSYSDIVFFYGGVGRCGIVCNYIKKYVTIVGKCKYDVFYWT